MLFFLLSAFINFSIYENAPLSPKVFASMVTSPFSNFNIGFTFKRPPITEDALPILPPFSKNERSLTIKYNFIFSCISSSLSSIFS